MHESRGCLLPLNSNITIDTFFLLSSTFLAYMVMVRMVKNRDDVDISGVLCLFAEKVLQLINSWGEIDSFIECFSPLVTNVGFNIKLFNCIIYRHNVRRLIDEIRDDWTSTRNIRELKILHDHGQTGRDCTIVYLTMISGAVMAWTSLPLIPIFMDMVVPLNESRPRIPYFPTDYRVDPAKYFYPMYLHSTAVATVATIIYVGIDTIFMTFGQHACAMFNILRYRLESMTQVHDEVSIRPNDNIRGDFYYRQMADCIVKHKRCIEYVCVMQASCQWYLLILAGLNMLVISVTCSQIVATGTSTEEALRFTFYTVAQVIHLFCNSLPGQWIMETSGSVAISVYCCNWYLMSPRTRELIVLFIKRSTIPCVITAGKIYTMSMENFCSVLQTSMSYVTLLSSMQ